VLAIALMLVFGAMGVVYCAWSDTITIDTTVEPGIVEMSLGCGESSPEVYCEAEGMTLEITVTPTPAGSYFCYFVMENSGSLPVKIGSIDLPDYVYTTGVVEGTQIDPYVPANGTVHITLDEAITEDLEFTVTFNIVLWNE
jgi:hypothetical protein